MLSALLFSHTKCIFAAPKHNFKEWYPQVPHHYAKYINEFPGSLYYDKNQQRWKLPKVFAQTITSMQYLFFIACVCNHPVLEMISQETDFITYLIHFIGTHKPFDYDVSICSLICPLISISVKSVKHVSSASMKGLHHAHALILSQSPVYAVTLSNNIFHLWIPKKASGYSPISGW